MQCEKCFFSFSTANHGKTEILSGLPENEHIPACSVLHSEESRLVDLGLPVSVRKAILINDRSYEQECRDANLVAKG